MLPLLAAACSANSPWLSCGDGGGGRGKGQGIEGREREGGAPYDGEVRPDALGHEPRHCLDVVHAGGRHEAVLRRVLPPPSVVTVSRMTK